MFWKVFFSAWVFSCKFAAYFHLWKAASERHSLLYLYSISLASRTRDRKTLFLFWRYVATTKNILSKLLKFYSILFHFALFSFYSTGSLKNNEPTRWILTTLRKARENVCEQSSHEFLNAVKFSQLLSWQHAMPHKILQFWAIFEPRYLRNTTYKWIDFLDFIQIIQNGSTGEWKYDETFFTTVQHIRIEV